jgi:uncharacterized damage-inducible protein DinB
MTPDDIRRLVAYDRLGNDLTLASLATSFTATSPAPERAVAVMAHIIGAERLWLARIEGEPSPLAVWPALDLDGSRRELEALDLPWAHLLGQLDPATLAREVHYTNSRGDTFTNRVDDILQHVVLHSAHHRGQIAAAVRAAGGTPAYTDYIHIVRSGLIPR